VHALEAQFGENPLIEEGGLLPIEGTPAGRAIQSLQTVLVTRAELESSPSPLVQSVVRSGIKSGCVAPLISHGQVLGTIDLASTREDAFSQADAELATQIAGQIAIAVENALNFERAREAEQELARKLEHLRLMLKITNAVVSQLDLQELLQ